MRGNAGKKRPPVAETPVTGMNAAMKAEMNGESGLTDPGEHRRYMEIALREAMKAAEAGEAPVGAVVVHEGLIIGRAHNQRETLRDPTAHAEILALTQAAAALDRWRLTGARLYVTLEPCVMCAGAMVLARIDALIYGATDPKAGACGSLYDIPRDGRLNHRLEVTAGVMADECGALLSAFFARRRARQQDA